MTMPFPYNQPEKTHDCGYRCMYYVIQPLVTYEEWLDQFRFFDPINNGISFNDICTVLKYYKLDSRFTQLDDKGTFIIYSGSWLKHGHYFIYENGVVLCSTMSGPERMPLDMVLARLEEGKTVEKAFRCLKVIR